MPETPVRWWIWHLDQTMQVEHWRAATSTEAAWAIDQGMWVILASSREVHGIRFPRVLGPDDIDLERLKECRHDSTPKQASGLFDT